MVTGTVVLDLSRDSESRDRRATSELYALPEGVRVRVDVGARDFAPPWTVAQLRQYVGRVHFDVHGTTSAVTQWVRLLRDGESVRGGWL